MRWYAKQRIQFGHLPVGMTIASVLPPESSLGLSEGSGEGPFFCGFGILVFIFIFAGFLLEDRCV